MSGATKKPASANCGNVYRDEDAARYEVGYGKPPAQHRFRKGKLSNPGGRPKGATSKVPRGAGTRLRYAAGEPDAA